MEKKQLWKICYNKYIKYLFIIGMDIVKKKYLMTFMFFGLIIYSLIAWIIYLKNPFKLDKKYDLPMNIGLIIFGFVILSSFIFLELDLKEFHNYKKLFKIILYFLLIFLLIAATIYFTILIVENPNMNTIVSIFTRILQISIILFSLTLLYRYLSSSLPIFEKKYPNLGLLINIILYLPCLIGDTIDLWREQYKITSKTTLIIFYLELFLIGLYILIPIFKKLYNKHFVPFIKNNLPYIYNKFFHSNYTILQEDPIYTNEEKTLGTFPNFKDSKKKEYNYNYGLYFDLWINPQPANTNIDYSRETPLMNYANKLVIYYYNNELIFKALKNNDEYETVFKTKNFLYQSWNNIAINYYSGSVDIFINNELVGTLNGIIPYMKVDNIIAGSINGIYGGIKNIIYSDKPLSLSNIRYLSFSL